MHSVCFLVTPASDTSPPAASRRSLPGSPAAGPRLPPARAGPRQTPSRTSSPRSWASCGHGHAQGAAVSASSLQPQELCAATEAQRRRPAVVKCVHASCNPAAAAHGQVAAEAQLGRLAAVRCKQAVSKPHGHTAQSVGRVRAHMVSGMPSSCVKNCCTGALHRLTHMPAHALSARYLLAQARQCLPGRRRAAPPTRTPPGRQFGRKTAPSEQPVALAVASAGRPVSIAEAGPGGRSLLSCTLVGAAAGARHWPTCTSQPSACCRCMGSCEDGRPHRQYAASTPYDTATLIQSLLSHRGGSHLVSWMMYA